MSTNKIDNMTGTEAKALLNDICNELGIGGKARIHSTVMACIGNASRRSACLGRIETLYTETIVAERCPVELLVRRERNRLKLEIDRMITVRANSTLKLDIGQSSLDYTYPKGVSVDAIAEDLLRAVLFNKGATGTQTFLDEFMKKHYDMPGCN